MKMVELIGVPYAAGCREETSFASDQQSGPAAIRKALAELMGGFNIPRAFSDLGDIVADAGVDAVLRSVEAAVTASLQRGACPVILGGAHTLTLGVLRALRTAGHTCSLIYVDAHPDMMPHKEVNWGSSLYYAFQEGLLLGERVSLLGIRQIEQEERHFIERHRIQHFPPTAIESVGLSSVMEQVFQHLPPPYYLSIDIDAIDPTFAPGVAAPFPGGLSTREAIFIAKEAATRQLLGAEIVELSPGSDRNEMSARVAAVLLHELTTQLSSSSPRNG